MGKRAAFSGCDLLLFEPVGNVANDAVALVIEEEEVEAFGVEFACGFFRIGKGGRERFDIFGIGEDVFSSMKEEQGDVDGL